jgi:leucyl aminopeptidase
MDFNSPIKVKKYNNDSVQAEVVLIEKGKASADLGLESWQIEAINNAHENNSNFHSFPSASGLKVIVSIDLSGDKAPHLYTEAARKAGNNLLAEIKKFNVSALVVSHKLSTCFLHEFAEGLVMGAYAFQKYLSKKSIQTIETVYLNCGDVTEQSIAELNTVLEANYITRDLVNEPVITLTATKLSEAFVALGKQANFNVKVLNKAELEKQGFGGLLSVNMGSIEPPTFSIMEYKPANAINTKPYLLVGKGLVYDTGGLSLKPTANSMDSMKSDMAGSAAVAGAMYAIAKNNLPLYMVALVPATDNRPGENAYTPGDIITMHNGKTVEVLNTDAEGRLILGDALSYGAQYEPELCLDLATLTGAQVIAVGSLGAAIMGTASEEQKTALKNAGNQAYERVAEMPFWDEYGEKVKSDIADLKNVGGPEGGCITAGKFLESFVSYPWIHIDIAGPSFLGAKSSYIPKGGTGFGVRLLYNFFKSKVK